MKPRKQAVALEYGMNQVPVVSAKGDEHLAERLIEEARRQGVYVTQDPQLLLEVTLALAKRAKGGGGGP